MSVRNLWSTRLTQNVMKKLGEYCLQDLFPNRLEDLVRVAQESGSGALVPDVVAMPKDEG